MKMTIDEALSNMWHIADKPERLRCFHKIAFEIGFHEGEQFWSNFWSIWSSSENLNDDEEFIAPLVRYGRALGEPELGLEEDEREFLLKIDQAKIYRGCGAWNQNGWSWSIDRDKAIWFAKRAFGPKQRIVITTTVDRAQIIGYLTGRGESEIVVDPATLGPVIVDHEFKADSEHSSSAIFYAAQSGRLNQHFGDHSDIKAKLMVDMVRCEEYGATLTHAREILEFAEWAGIESQIGFYKAVIKEINKRAKVV